MKQIKSAVKKFYRKYIKKYPSYDVCFKIYCQHEKEIVILFDEILDILLKKTDSNNQEDYLLYLLDKLKKIYNNQKKYWDKFPDLATYFSSKNLYFFLFDDVSEKFNTILRKNYPIHDQIRTEWHERFVFNQKNKIPMWKKFLSRPVMDLNKHYEEELKKQFYIYPDDEFVKEYLEKRYKMYLKYFFSNVLRMIDVKFDQSISNVTINNYVKELDEIRDFMIKTYNIDFYNIKLSDIWEGFDEHTTR